jgi:type IV pilus assembly protein PilC
MPKFAYTAIESATGREKKAVIDSASSEQAALDLKALGLLPTSITAAAGGPFKLPPKAAPKAGAKAFVPNLSSEARKTDAPLE